MAETEDRVTAQVDMVYEESTLAGAIANVENTYGVAVRVIEEFGPAGGNPFIELSGTRAQMERALREGWDFDDEQELAEYLKS